MDGGVAYNSTAARTDWFLVIYLHTDAAKDGSIAIHFISNHSCFKSLGSNQTEQLASQTW
jgi:hypothetical protein